MRPGKSHRDERGALVILEEAMHLLCVAPAGAFLYYYVGALPFMLGLLFFWADMSCSGTAGTHLIQASFGLAALYLWMKCWQAVFASRLLALLHDTLPSPWNAARIARLVGIQSAVMPWSLILLPVALVIALPLGWCYAFFNNISVMGSGEQGLKASVRTAWHQSTLWPAQNHKVLLILLLFSFFVFSNLGVTLYLVPSMLKSFLGVETVLSKSNLFFLNSTFLLSVAGITWLCISPLVKAAYILRCYYGESLHTGRDLLAELGRVNRIARQSLFLILTFASFWLLYPVNVNAAPGQPGRQQFASPVISAEKLDREIADMIQKLEYTWRFPPEKKEDQKKSGFLAQAMDAVGRWLDQTWQWVKDLVERFFRWLEKIMPEPQPKSSPGMNILGDVRLWLTILLVAVILSALWLVYRMLLRRRSGAKNEVEEDHGIKAEPDLASEKTTADELPPARWLALARELLERGELRLALRAFYFSALAHLAEQNLLTLASFKSNREYERELKRRAHAFPGLVGAFSDNVNILERVWYGMHDVQREAVEEFLHNYKRITANEQAR